jgi:N-methylhydantoinase A/oxoprolinase/acetone carboxylase beta subunit
VRRALADAHIERFGHADLERDVEIVVARVKSRAAGFQRLASDRGQEPVRAGGDGEKMTATVVWDRPRRTSIRERASIRQTGKGRSGIAGPAILTQLDTTTLVPPGWRARPDRSGSGNLILRRNT